MGNAGDAGIVHPGALGARVGAQAVAAGARAWWVQEGRSADTRRRAAEAGPRTATDLAEPAERCATVLSA
ncbi:hypothetical protein AB5J72_45785 [Streptomyces sp. CG1]|uniref:hypothetical protein n=1 Tax=Streptomyces sp. CG1 TaxID=1287523 RepID=UPI0034E1FE6A